jgi:threonine dehydratase
MGISLRDFELASRRLEGIIHKTELDFSSTFSEMSGGEVYLKCENRQKTGSFKIRGAANKIAALAERGEPPLWWPLPPATMPRALPMPLVSMG